MATFCNYERLTDGKMWSIINNCIVDEETLIERRAAENSLPFMSKDIARIVALVMICAVLIVVCFTAGGKLFHKEAPENICQFCSRTIFSS